MTTIEFIPKENRNIHSELISQISNAVFGDIDKIKFSEKFVPLQARVPEPKVQMFSSFLVNIPQCLWAVRFNNIVVGFILISNIPNKHSIGFGIDVNYARLGIISFAWSLIRFDNCIKYPLYAFTSQNNDAANLFLSNNGFIRSAENPNFMGELSYKYVLIN